MVDRKVIEEYSKKFSEIMSDYEKDVIGSFILENTGVVTNPEFFEFPTEVEKHIYIPSYLKINYDYPYTKEEIYEMLEITKKDLDLDDVETYNLFMYLFVDFMDTVDVFLSDAPDCVEYFQLFSDTPVRFILYPYPLEYVSKFRVPLEKRDKRILKMGVTGGRIGSEGHDALLLMRSILDEYQAFDGYAVSMDGTWNGSAGFGKIQFHTERPWKEFLKDVVSRSYIAIDLDSAHTHGRTAADCAALGVPCIGVNSSAQQLLFPKLTFGETEYAAMKDVMLTLLNDRTFWLQCSEEAMSFSEMYSYSAARDEMERLYREWKNGAFEKSTERGI